MVLTARASSAYEPDFRKQPFTRFIYSWPALVFILTYLSWFLWQLVSNQFSYTLFVPDGRLVDAQYYYMALPALLLQGFAVFVYLIWVGWKFFQHN